MQDNNQDQYSSYISKDEITKEKDYSIYEKWFIPINDEQLKNLGLEISAQMVVKEGEGINLNILFKRGEKISSIECVHVIVGRVYIDEKNKLIYEEKSIEGNPEVGNLLSYEEQFFALKSYVEGLVELGIENILIESIKHDMEENQELKHINQLMRSQIIHALLDIAPETCKKILLYLLEFLYVQDPKRFNAAFWNFEDDFLEEILNDIISNEKLSNELIEKLVYNEDEFVREQILLRGDLPTNLLVKFSEDEDPYIRFLIAKRKNLPLSTIKKLSEDKNSEYEISDIIKNQSYWDFIERFNKYDKDLFEKLLLDDSFLLTNQFISEIVAKNRNRNMEEKINKVYDLLINVKSNIKSAKGPMYSCISTYSEMFDNFWEDLDYSSFEEFCQDQENNLNFGVIIDKFGYYEHYPSYSEKEFEVWNNVLGLDSAIGHKIYYSPPNLREIPKDNEENSFQLPKRFLEIDNDELKKLARTIVIHFKPIKQKKDKISRKKIKEKIKELNHKKPVNIFLGNQYEIPSDEIIRKEINIKKGNKIKKSELKIFTTAYIPFKDMILKKLGIFICPYLQVHNQDIWHCVIYLQNNEGFKYFISLDERFKIKPRKITTKHSDIITYEVEIENEPEALRIKRLSPIEVYLGLKSFIEGIIEIGIENSLLDSLKKIFYEDSPNYLIDINLFTNLTLAILRFSPKLGKSLIKFALEQLYTKNPKKFHSLFIPEYYEFRSLNDAIYRVIETDDSLSGNLLNKLVQDEHYNIKRAVASRKNLPIELIDNIINYNGKNHWEFKRIIARRNDLSLDIINKLVATHNSSVMKELAGNENLPYEIIEKIIGYPDTGYKISNRIINDENMPQEWIERFADGSIESMKAVARRKILSPSLLDKLARNYGARSIIASREDLPKEYLQVIFDNVRSEVYRGAKIWITKEALARRDDIPEEFVIELAKDEHDYVRKAIAARNDLSKELIVTLANDENPRVREIIAKNESTPDNIVEKLAKESDQSIKFAIARRKKLPIKLMNELVRDGTWGIKKEIAKRDDLPPDIIEFLLETNDYRILKEFAQKTDVSLDILKKIIKNKFVQQEVAKIENLPIEIMRILANEGDQETRCVLAERKDLPIEIIDILVKHNDYKVNQKLVKIENLPAHILEQLANDSNIIGSIATRKDLPINLIEKLLNENHLGVGEKILDRDDLPINIIKQALNKESTKQYIIKKYAHIDMIEIEIAKLLVKKNDYLIRSILAYKEKIPDQFVKMLANDKNYRVRALIARREDLPNEILKNFAKDEKILIRKLILHNKNLPLDVLKILALDKDYYIRNHVRNIIETKIKTDISLIKALIQDSNYEIRDIIGNFEKLAPEIILTLAKDSDPKVRNIISCRSDLSSDLIELFAKDPDPDVRSNIACRKKISIDLINWLANDENNNVRAHIAGREQLPVELLNKFALDSNSRIRSTVASSPNLSKDLINILINDKNVKVRQNIANRDDLQLEHLRKLANDENIEVKRIISQKNNLSVEIIKKLIKSNDFKIKKNFSEKEVLSPEIINELAYDKDDRIRVLIVKRKNIPVETVDQLANDENLLIRKMIRKNYFS